MSPENPEQELREVDEEIQQLEARIHILRSTHNRLSPISRSLATEILALIFFFAKKSSKGPHGHTSLVISWVCHDWRIIALAYPVLWGDIQTTNLAWIQASLARARHSPLTVTVDLPRHPNEQSMRAPTILLQHLSQMRSFTLLQHICREHTPRYISLDLDKPVPLLEELSLSQVDFKADMFPGGFPRLRKLALSHCNGWSEKRCPSSLVSFSLCHPSTRTPAATMLKVLQHLPNLEELALNGAMQEGLAESNRESKPIIHFHNLRSVIFRAEHCPAVNFLFQSITIPPSALVVLNLIATRSNSDHVEVVKALQACRRDPTKQWNITHLQTIWSQSVNHYDIWITATNSLGQSTPIIINPFSWRGRITPDVLKVLDLHSLQSLEFQGDMGGRVPVPLSIWDEAFARLPNLHTITVRGSCVSHFLDHVETDLERLLARLNQPLVNGDESLLSSFPALRKLVIGLDLRQGRYVIVQLKQALSMRRHLVGRLRELVFVGDTIPEDPGFKDEADKVIWGPPSQL